MNTYSDYNPPKSGTAKKIYDALKANGWIVKDLHYNPNCWGHASGSNGWGTWACEIWGTEYPSESRHRLHETGFFCGVKDGEVYLQNVGGGFAAWSITPSNTAWSGLVEGGGNLPVEVVVVETREPAASRSRKPLAT